MKGPAVTTPVEGIPLSFVKQYIDRAVGHARVRDIGDGLFVSSVAGLDGAWAEGHSAEDALAELREALMGWIAVKARVGASIPDLDGLDINPRNVGLGP